MKAVAAADARLAPIGNEPMAASPEEVDAMVKQQIAVNTEVAKAAGVVPK